MHFALWAKRRFVRAIIAAVSVLCFVQWYNLRGGGFRKGGLGSLPGLGKAKATFEPSSFNWAAFKHKYPVPSFIPLPTGKPLPLPRVQYNFGDNSAEDTARWTSQRDAVRTAFQKCWKSYRKYAWMKDELTPLSARSQTTFGGWAATLIDSLDTLWIMDLRDEFYEAVRAVAYLDWAKYKGTSCNVFETTIRHLGGLLSAYDLSQEEVLLMKAVELGDMLYAAFDTPNRMPPFWLEFKTAKAGFQKADTHAASASPCSLSLEFTRLAQLTGDDKYYDAIARISIVLEENQNKTKLPGMWPQYINMREQTFNQENSFTIGASADSLYEYLPKAHAILGGLEPIYEKMWLATAPVIEKEILFRPMLPYNDDILFPGTTRVSRYGDTDLEPEGEHLGCFVGGMFALGGKLFNNPSHVRLGAKLTKGCIYAYNAFPSGIMPEIFAMLACKGTSDAECQWNETRWLDEGDEKLPRGFRLVRAKTYILRPEAIESVFLMYRITGEESYREEAWKMFQSIMKATETKYANAGVDDVTVENPGQLDTMESFWLAETLKYFYLIFSEPDLINLDTYVFNTEAHPLLRPIWKD